MSTVENRATNALIDFLNAAAAALIDLDPDGKRKLAALRGKVFCVEITAPPVTLYVLPAEQGVEFSRTLPSPSQPDVTLSGSALAFAKLGAMRMRPGEKSASDGFKQSRVTVRGDAELGQALQKILSELDLDWEELLSRYVGDTPARKVGNALRDLAGWAEKSAALTRENVADYLTEEKRILVTDLAMQRFDQALDRTRADVDRLTRRAQRLQHALDQISNRD